MKENPVCKDENYLVTVFAYLKHLKYLDYELVSSTAVKSGAHCSFLFRRMVWKI
jgi:hypothetical protein